MLRIWIVVVVAVTVFLHRVFNLMNLVKVSTIKNDNIDVDIEKCQMWMCAWL